MGKHGARMGEQIAMSPAEFIGQQRSHAGCIYHVTGPICGAFRGDELHVICVKRNVLNGRVLKNGGAVGNGQRGQQIVRVLTVYVRFMAIGQFGNYGL